jgi:HD-GYP domain-containing protein (c-di-GMP phosphodiesterase class II)
MERVVVLDSTGSDALRNERPYKKTLDVETSMGIVAGSARSHFDPGVYAMFERILPRIEEIREGLQRLT